MGAGLACGAMRRGSSVAVLTGGVFGCWDARGCGLGEAAGSGGGGAGKAWASKNSQQFSQKESFRKYCIPVANP